MSCLQRLDALEANNRTNNNVQRNRHRVEVESWRHTRHREHGVARSAHRISYIRLSTKRCLLATFGEVLHEVKLLPQMRIALEAVLLKLHAKLAPGRAVFRECALFLDTTV